MLTCKIGWRTVIPVRAIPILTGGTLDASDLANLFFHLDGFGGDNFSPSIRPIRVGVDGSWFGVAPTEWGIAYYHFASKQQNAFRELKHIRHLPPGVFVWRRQFKILYDFLKYEVALRAAVGVGDILETAQQTRRERWETDPCLQRIADKIATNLNDYLAKAGVIPAGYFDWAEKAQLTPRRHAMVWEGCASLGDEHRVQEGTKRNATAPTESRSPIACGRTRRKELDENPRLQRIAEGRVTDLKSAGKRIPSLKELVPYIRQHRDFDPQLADVEDRTIERRIRATWKERKR